MTSCEALLIGEGSVLVRCGEVLLAKGHRVHTVVSRDMAARRWATKAGIRNLTLDEIDPSDLRLAFDVLFSIGNHSIIPTALLKNARRMNINYHYGPLPEYSGLEVPAWAILEGATSYAITWHRIGDVIDGGNILRSAPVAVEAHDTALSLGLKCDEAAVQSFGALLDDLEQGRQTETSQDLTKRRYFSRAKQLPTEGLIDWTQPAERIAAMARATDYGPFSSPLVWPKVRMGGQLIAVRGLDVADESVGVTPGEVLHVDDDGIHVATGSRSVVMRKLTSLEGDTLVPSEVATTAQLVPGTQLRGPSHAIGAEIAKAGARASKTAAYWREKLQAFKPYRLPYITAAVANEDPRDPPIVDKCNVASDAAALALAPSEYLIAAWITYFARASGMPEVHVALAAPPDDLLGEYRTLFSNWVPFVARVDASAPVVDSMKAIGLAVRDARANGSFRSDVIGRDTELRGRAQRGELAADILISWGDQSDPSNSRLPNGNRPALELSIGQDEQEVEFRWEQTRMTRRNVARLAAQLTHWRRRLPSIMQRTLASVPPVVEQEHAVLVDEFNATRNDATLGQCFHHLFQAAVRLHGDKDALVCDGVRVSYEQLNADANWLARHLAERGVVRGSRVGVCLDRSIDLVVALLAVMKTGAAYVPIDLSFPSDRIRQMVDDAAPSVIIAPGDPPAALRSWEDRCICMDDLPGRGTGTSVNPDVSSAPTDLAYIIYTSGSTGKPKGVEVTHGALCNFLSSMQQRPGCTAADRLLAITTISFDIAALELFLPLTCGASVVIAERHDTTDGNALLRLMREHSITVMQATPTTWQILLQLGWRGQTSLSRLLCGGETLPRALADQLLSCADTVWNLYGPTETTVWSSVWQVKAGEDVVIGTPIANTQLYVLDANLAAVPVGFTGEICIGGAGVARGYHNDPDQTASRFVPNPFRPGMLYRTGDIGRFKEPGVLALQGRNDDQIKLRGFRIELGEVENAITSHPEVAGSVALVRNDRLVAYCLRAASPPVDTRSDAVQDTLAQWRGAWDRAYETQSVASEPTFNTAGWSNSYDGRPFSKTEMREWQTRTVERILGYQPERVFEIGSGSGLILFGVAPHCRSYRAIDASKRAVDLVQSQLKALPHVSCEHRMASDLPEIAPGAFDTVVINSVVQYFPSIDYLMSVLAWAGKVVTHGRIFVGDVRDLSMLSVFHADIVEYRNQGVVAGELRQRIERSRQSDRELAIAPEFFANLPSLLPHVSSVEIALRKGSGANEMTRYRYDVTLHVGDSPRRGDAAVAIQDWRHDGVDLAGLRRRLERKSDAQLRLSNIPNERLSDVAKRVSGLIAPATNAVSNGMARPPWVRPEDVEAVAAEAGYACAVMPSRSRDVWSFDAVLWDRERATVPDLTWRPAATMDRQALAPYANVPASVSARRTPLDRLLRPWLDERLPTYMVPAFFVELNEFPLTPNGKIDRKALPDPVDAVMEPALRPKGELEHQILAIWSTVLGHDRISVDANFFEIGGDSLRVVAVQTQLERLLGRPIPVATLYDHFTIKGLAAQLLGGQKPARVIPKRRRTADADIAIVSMACRFPGGVRTPEDFWALLERGGDAIAEVPADRWDARAIYNADPEVIGTSYCQQGGFVDQIDMFDAAFFGVSPREARAVDPEQRLLLEVTWEALERAGYTADQLRASLTGVFVGIGMGYHEYGLALAGGLCELDGYVGTGSAGCTMSGRVSYVLGLEGPSVTVDTACSSSLVTAHLACNALRQGECDLALASGVTLMIAPDLFVEFSRLRGMAPDGRCKSFSSSADGTGWSEGCGVLVLKRLADAERDGDSVLAIIRGTAVNHGGHSATLTTPSGFAQQRVVRQALAASGLEPNDIDYVEAHGTGTRLGDPIEATSLGEVFGGRTKQRPLWVGSVKSNIGHTQAAAGVAGMIKTILAMQHETLPPTLHVDAPSPAVDWASMKMALVEDPQPWRRNGAPRRAGISSFGIGGTNAHVILEESSARRIAAPRAEVAAARLPSLPFVLSGFTEGACRAQADRLKQHLTVHPDQRLEDVAFSLATARTHFRKRVVLFAKDRAELVTGLAAFSDTGETPASATRGSRAKGEGGSLALLFSGQGSQLPGMGRDLYGIHSVFRAALDEIVAHFSGLERPLLDVMWAEAGTANAALLHRTDFTQPALFALEVALWRLWDSWGITPSLLLGHSIGELAAAHVAGVFDLADACRLVGARGRLMEALPRIGAMASLEASGAEVRAAIEKHGLSAKVDIAGLNAPLQTVVSGDADGVEKMVAHFSQAQRKAKRLEVSHAFHSHLMDGMLADFLAVAETIRFSPPRTTLISSLTGAPARPEEITQGEYWVKQVRQAVLFEAGMRTLHNEGATMFLELGPQPVLSGMGAACLESAGPLTWLPSLRPGRDGTDVMQRSLAELHLLGVAVDWARYFAPLGAVRVPLPTYAFQRERYWLEPAEKREGGGGLTDTGHPLLGASVHVAATEMTVFSTTISTDSPSWLIEHQVLDTVVLPGTAFFEAMRAAGTASDKGTCDVADVIMLTPLVMGPNAAARLQVTVGPSSGDSRPVRVYSRAESDQDATTWQLHAEGRLVPAAAPTHEGAVTLPPQNAASIDVLGFYDSLRELGYGYGPTFQGLAEAWRVGATVWARAALPDSAVQAATRYGLHPALLDSAMHSVLLTEQLADHGRDDVYVPFQVEQISLWQTGLAEVWVTLTEFEMSDGDIRASLDLFDGRGIRVGRLQGLRARRVDRAVLRRLTVAGVERFHFHVDWRQPEQEVASLSGTWALLPCGQVDFADEVRSILKTHGADVVAITDIKDAQEVVGVICLWQSHADVVAEAHDLSALALKQIQDLWAIGADQQVVWVTRDAVGTSKDDRVTGLSASPLWGLMRTARTENPDLASRLIDIGTDAADLDALPAALMLSGEPECAVRAGQLLVPRLDRATTARGLVLPAEGSWRLEIAKRGRLDHPLDCKVTKQEPLAAGWIRASVKAAGLNFRDVLNALGMVEFEWLGLEFAGVVTEVGAGVTDLNVGDAVLGLARGAFGSHVVTDAREVVRMPDCLSFEEAATIPMVFLTAWYGLHDLARMSAGEKVLVHAAAGGVGMAAVQLAQLHGAEVYGTASEGKWDALRTLGLTDDHIASSRTIEFANSFRSTDRRFDVVVNSLAGEFIDAGLGLLGDGGRFIEMGKTDVREQSWIAEHHRGVAYHLLYLLDAGPDRIKQMLAALAVLFAEGKLKPLPLRTFPLDRTSDALRFMAQARHVGKVVLVPPQQRQLVQPDGAVLVTGGLGGLGKHVARWLASEHGVKDLVLTSRQGLRSPDAAELVAELAEHGATATVVACDVADRAAVVELMKTFTKDRPLRGVVHAAGVLDDGVLTALTPARLATVFLPKVDGAWHLHQLTQDLDLDLFVMFSSISGAIGVAGQGNYAAANTFLDSLAQHRAGRGLPGCSVAWGAWAGAGMAARLSEADRARFSRNGMDALTADEGMALFEMASTTGGAMSVAAALDLPRLRRGLEERGDVPALFRSLLERSAGARSSGGTPRNSDGLRKLLAASPVEQHEAIVLRMVQGEVAKILEFSSPDKVDVNLSLQDMGVDSLTAVLLKNQLADITGLTLPAKIAFDHPNLLALAQFLLAQLNSAEPGATTPAVQTVLVAPRVEGGLQTAYLEPLLQYRNDANEGRKPTSIFVTGATGFVGAFLLHELLNSDAAIYCLVRARDVDHATSRLKGTLDDYGLWRADRAHLIKPVVGDLDRRLFGLEEVAFNQLAENVDAICHAGALVDWMQSLETYWGPNIVGTHEVLRLAACGRTKPVHFISTYATLPRHQGYQPPADDRESGYVQTKWLGEQMVAAARWRGALASVYRLPLVGADSRTGSFRLDRGDFVHNLISGCIELGCFPELDCDLRALIPINYVAELIGHVIAQDPKRIGRSYDFINPTAPSFSRFVELLKAAGCPLEVVGFDEWRKRALEHAKVHKKGAFSRIEMVMDGLPKDDLELMFRGYPVGDVLTDPSHPFPPVDDSSVSAYVRRMSDVADRTKIHESNQPE